MRDTLTIDIETHDADLMWDLLPEQMFRLGGYSWGNSPIVTLTEDIEEMKDVIADAKYVIGHNIHRFDLTVLYGVDNDWPLKLAHAGRILDSWTHAELVDPAPEMWFTNRLGKMMKCHSPAEKRRWFALEEIAHRHNVPGKLFDLKELAKLYGGYGNIPTDDDRYREYLRQDVLAARYVMQSLMRKGPLDDYAMREQRIAGICAQISRTGWRVDQELARDMVIESELERDHHLRVLIEKGMPSEGKAPWSTKEGKEAILRILKEYGVDESALGTTATGNVSLGKESVKKAVRGRGREAEAFGSALAALNGERSLPKQALDYTRRDGKVHPSVETLQLSGRCSTTQPGLTTWTSRGPGSVNKAIFIPNRENDLLVSVDLSNADARVVAGYSGDLMYALRFRPGQDGHMINALIFWGEELVKSDPEYYRNRGKPIGHAWAYNAGAKKIAYTTELPYKEVKVALENLNNEYSGVVKWQKATVKKANESGKIVNDWGRAMPVSKDRAYTQAPALLGQSGTREILWDGVLKLPLWLQICIVCQVHDELILSIPQPLMTTALVILRQCLETKWKPKEGGQMIEFPVNIGEPAGNWQDATHE